MAIQTWVKGVVAIFLMSILYIPLNEIVYQFYQWSLAEGVAPAWTLDMLWWIWQRWPLLFIVVVIVWMILRHQRKDIRQEEMVYFD